MSPQSHVPQICPPTRLAPAVSAFPLYNLCPVHRIVSFPVKWWHYCKFQCSRFVSILPPLAHLALAQLAMVMEDPDVNPYEELGLLSDEIADQPEPGPRCARCDQVRLHEWINWQKCWSNPCTGADGRTWILVYPIGRHPIMLLLHSQGIAGDLDFWWFFICNRCRFQFRMRGLITECSEIEDRYTTGPQITPTLVRLPTLVPQNLVRNREINGPLGVSEYWSRSSSPASSVTSDPWMGLFTGFPSNIVNAPN